MSRGNRQGQPEWTADWKGRSFWLDGLDPVPGVADTAPASVDVAIIGSGYTGLNAALETVRGGRSTVVIDAGDIGGGCSTRNGGQISTSIKPSLDSLTAKFGPDRGRAIRDEGKTALEWIEQRVDGEGIDCGFKRCGRFHAAHTPDHFDALVREAEILNRDEGIETQVIPRDQQHRELGSDLYHGGVVFPRHAALDPGRYHRGLLRAVLGAGATVVHNCRAIGVDRDGDGFLVRTHKGPIAARDVIVATNGYTGDAVPWLQRRVIPIGSYVIATEPLPADLMARLFPTGRIVSDSRKVVYYFRPCSEHRRIVFGGRVSSGETDPRVSGPRLFADMCRIFPELSDFRISHSWMGTVAYSFDELAHTGVHDGIHYALGYCGSGVSMASYLGMRTGQKVLGLAEGRTAFDDIPFPTRPLYTGKPWFLPAVVAWYRWRDNREFDRSALSA